MRTAWVTVLVMLLGAPALAQGEPSAFEQRPFPVTQTLAPDVDAPRKASPSMMPDLGRLVLALGIVIGLILSLRKLFGRFVQQPGQSPGVVKLISRTAIAPRQQIVLIQIGKRVVALSDSAGAVTRICEITDADEIAGLLGRDAEPVTSFSSELTAAESRIASFESTPPSGEQIDRPVGQSLARADHDLKSLIERVKGITRSMKS